MRLPISTATRSPCTTPRAASADGQPVGAPVELSPADPTIVEPQRGGIGAPPRPVTAEVPEVQLVHPPSMLGPRFAGELTDQLVSAGCWGGSTDGHVDCIVRRRSARTEAALIDEHGTTTWARVRRAGEPVGQRPARRRAGGRGHARRDRRQPSRVVRDGDGRARTAAGRTSRSTGTGWPTSWPTCSTTPVSPRWSSTAATPTRSTPRWPTRAPPSVRLVVGIDAPALAATPTDRRLRGADRRRRSGASRPSSASAVRCSTRRAPPVAEGRARLRCSATPTLTPDVMKLVAGGFASMFPVPGTHAAVRAVLPLGPVRLLVPPADRRLRRGDAAQVRRRRRARPDRPPRRDQHAPRADADEAARRPARRGEGRLRRLVAWRSCSTAQRRARRPSSEP